MSRSINRGEEDRPGGPTRGRAPSAGVRDALGPLQSVRATASRTHKINLAIASAFTVLPAGAAVLLGVNALLGPPGRGLGYAALFFGGLALLPAVGVFFLARKLWWRLRLYKNGFVLVRGREQAVLWDDVRSVFAGGLNIDQEVEFILNDGKRIKVDNSFNDFAAFSEAARAAVTQRVLARADAALAAGQGVSFGKLKLTRSGLEAEGKQPLAWAQVAEVTIEQRVSGQLTVGALVISARGAARRSDNVEWVARRISHFPNFDAFVELARRFTRVDV